MTSTRFGVTGPESGKPQAGAVNQLLMRGVWSNSPWAAVLLGCDLVGSGIQLALPLLLARAVDDLVDGRASGSGILLITALCVAAVALDTIGALARASASARTTGWLRRRLAERMVSRGMLSDRRFTDGDLVARITGNAAEVGMAGTAIISALAAVIPAAGGLVALALVDPYLTGAFCLGLPLLVWLSRTFLRDVSDVVLRYQTVQGDIAGRLLDALAGRRTIAAAGTVRREVRRVLRPLGELHDHGLAMWRAEARMSWRAGILVPLLEYGVIAVAGVRVVSGHLSVGQLLAAGRYATMAAGLIGMISSVSLLARARAGAARAADVLAVPAINSGKRHLPPGTGRLELSGVRVDAGDRALLSDVTLSVPGGSRVAVVGQAGSGKSVLAAVAGRLREPDSGTVLLDGLPLSEIDEDELAEQVRYAFARPHLIGTTVADAIGFASGPTPLRVVRDAARRSCAHGFVRLLPREYQTRLADAPLSGGESQRLGIARALCGPGRLLIVDDALSSLDTVTEAQVTKALAEAFSGRTQLLITHRVASAARADFVIWLEGGVVRGIGTHGRLWAEPDYRAVFQPLASQDSSSL